MNESDKHNGAVSELPEDIQRWTAKRQCVSYNDCAPDIGACPSFSQGVNSLV